METKEYKRSPAPFGIQMNRIQIGCGGIGYIVIPEGGDNRELYIQNCMRTNTVSIQGGAGRSIYNDVPIPPSVLETVEFPVSTEEFGTPIVWVLDEYNQWPVVVNSLDLRKFNQQQPGQRTMRKESNGVIAEMKADASQGIIDIYVNGTEDTPAELNIFVHSANADSKINITSDADIAVSGDKNVEITSASRITAHILNGVDTEAGIELILQDDELQYTTKGGKSTFIVKGDQASFNGGANRGVINIAQIESLVQALQKDLLIASSGSNLSQWMASEMPKMEDKKLSH